jgi:hypothetical protein
MSTVCTALVAIGFGHQNDSRRRFYLEKRKPQRNTDRHSEVFLGKHSRGGSRQRIGGDALSISPNLLNGVSKTRFSRVLQAARPIRHQSLKTLSRLSRQGPSAVINRADLTDGNHGDDFIRGQAGNDTILGDDGDDTIAGDDGRDLIFGQDGDDVIDGNGASDTIVGGDGADILLGGGSNDTILGEQGDDTINGNSGTDLASTGEGADTVSDVEIIDESFTLPATLLSGLDV